MKDKKLEEQFNEYFDGMEIPENLAQDAKRYVDTPRKRLPGFVKYASIAASFVLCCAVALTVILSSRTGNLFPSDSADTPNDEMSAQIQYADKEITGSYVDEYSLTEIDSSLRFLERFVYASNSDLTAEKYTFGDGSTAFIKANVTVVSASRQDAEIYVEFTEKEYAPLKDYGEGEINYYNSCPYYVTVETAEDGEPVTKLYFIKDNVKYYINIKSSDTESYINYLKIIL